MSITFGVFNPANGETDRFSTKEEAMQVFWQRMYALAIPHFHHTTYVVIEQHEDGTETWRNDSNEAIAKVLPHAEMQQLIEEMSAARKSQGLQTL